MMSNNQENLNNRELDTKKVKVYDLLSVIIIRFLFAICSMIGFFVVLCFLLNAKNDFDLKKYGIIEGFFGTTVFLVWKFYFTNKK